ncbi:efflux RND transporter periplasmic adaptor subunit [Elongatibacter sediminis]|uniref:Efflux RND transporter periplasmic adaptor subunit n=1 Tax=Elongatibacter sediminis TaxID=3119006 RepID=A0AAW9R5F2_9GAMM
MRPNVIVACACTALLTCTPPGVHARDAVPVGTQPLDAVLVGLEYSAPADVRSLNRSTLSAQLAAPVHAIHADIGQAVNAGDILVELDDVDYALALDQAIATLQSLEAQQAQAAARLRRARELIANQHLSDDELLARETDANVIAAQIEAQKVAVAIARRNLAKCRISAPFNGVVTERHAQLGAYVSMGSPLMDLVEHDRFELEADVPDELSESLNSADAIRFGSRGESWPVRLLRLSPVVDTERRSRRARFAFVDAAPAIGRSGEVVWRIEKGLLPAHLLVRRAGRLGVFLDDGGRAAFTPLPGAQEGRPVPVNLPGNTKIVVAGRERLQDGDSLDTDGPSTTAGAAQD